jgi:hypothetical protein
MRRSVVIASSGTSSFVVVGACVVGTNDSVDVSYVDSALSRDLD